MGWEDDDWGPSYQVGLAAEALGRDGPQCQHDVGLCYVAPALSLSPVIRKGRTLYMGRVVHHDGTIRLYERIREGEWALRVVDRNGRKSRMVGPRLAPSAQVMHRLEALLFRVQEGRR